ncbi:unnamed protein product [Ilex paraguariensis]|uniref:Epoxide hydrolase n=1 Tax=Ilex paraguariensis TaxID=185542 RepID=A0ABC8QVE9_9AQUA
MSPEKVIDLNEPGKAEEGFACADTANVIKKFFSTRDPKPPCIPVEVPATLPSWLTEEDIQYYAAKYNKKGFTGGLNYYGALDLRWELTGAWIGLQIQVPVKFIVGDLDITYNIPGIKDYIHKGDFKRDVPNLEVVVIEGVAHFLNQEKPEEVNAHIYEFIQKF